MPPATDRLRKKRILLNLILAISFSLSLSFFARDSYAVQVKKVQSGVVNFLVDDLAQSVNLVVDWGGTAVADTAKSLILLTPAADTSSRDGNFSFTPYFEDNQNIAILRDLPRTASAAGATLQVIEFNDGVTVYRGFTSMSKTGKIKTVNFTGQIAGIQNKAFSVVYARGPINTTADTEVLFCKSSLSSDVNGTYLTIERLRSSNDAGIVQGINIAWQVVVMDTDASVRSGTTQFPWNDADSLWQVTLNPAIANINKALLIFDFSGGPGTTTDGLGINGIEGQLMVKGTITNATTLSFTRQSAGGDVNDYVDINWKLVEFSDPSTIVTKGTQNMVLTATLPQVVPVTLPGGLSFDLQRSLPMISVQGGSGTTTTYLDDNSVMVKMGSATTLNLTRRQAAIAADVDWLVVEFSPLTLAIPNGSEIWKVGEVKNITWKNADSVAADLVDIKLCATGSTNIADYTLTIASGLSASSGSYAWTIPNSIGITNLIGATLRVAVVDTTLGGTRNYDYSNANFEIKGSIAVTAPNNGTEVWYIGDTNRNITWTKTGDLSYSTFSIRLSEDGGTLYNTVVADLLTQVAQCVGNSCSWTWPSVPDSVGINRKIRVFLAADAANVKDESDNNFEIRPNITLNVPASTASWTTGKTYRMEWTTTGLVGPVNFTYSVGGSAFAAPPGITNPVTGYSGGACPVGRTCYDWAIAPAALRGAAKIQLIKSDNANVKAFNTGSEGTGSGPNTTFTILGSVSVDSPLTSLLLRALQNQDIAFSLPGGAGSAGTSAGFTMKYCTDYSGADPNQNCSDGLGPQWTTMSLPTSGDGVNVGGSTPFTYTWKVADIIGDNVGIRAEEKGLNSNLIYDAKGPYKVRGYIAVNIPNATTDNILRVGGTKLIQWDATGSIGQVYIDMDKNSLGTYGVPILGPSAPAKYELVGAACNPLNVDASAVSFMWGKSTYYTDSLCTIPAGAIPDERCNPCNIKVYKTTEPTPATGAAAVSANFALKGSIANLRVTQASPYMIGQTIEIKWDPVPYNLNWGTVQLQYSKDGAAWVNFSNENGIVNAGQNDVAEPGNIPATSSIYLWKIPDENIIATTVRLRAALVGDTANTFADSAQFSVKGSVNLTGAALNGSATAWNIGTTNAITWTVSGAALGNVNIKYSKNSGADSYPYLIATKPSTDLSYSWCVGYNDLCAGASGLDNGHDPNLVIAADRNDQIKIKLEAVSDPSISDNTQGASPGTLIVQKQFIDVNVPAPTLEVSDPLDSATFKNVTWTTKGTLRNIFLRYDTGALTYPDSQPLNSGGLTFSDAGGYLWQVPDAIGYNTLRFRVKSEIYGSNVYGDSAAFTIKGKILFIAPVASETLVVGKSYNIQYKKLGSVGNLRIDYIHTGNALNTVISPGSVPGPEGASGATSFTWNEVAATGGSGISVIDVGTVNSQFKLTGLTHLGNANLEASVLSSNFKIRGDINDGTVDSKALIEPSGNVYQIGGANQFIKWKAKGIIGNVRVRLDLNSGRGDDNLVNTLDDYVVQVRRPDSKCGLPPCYADSVAYNLDEALLGGGASSLEWIIPNTPSTLAKIRIESVDNSYDYTNPTKPMATYALSASPFRIKGSLAVTTPNTAVSYKVNDPISIDWNTLGTNIGNVSIVLYYDNDGTPYANSLVLTSNNGGVKPYPWTFTAGVVAETAIIRITAVGDSQLTDDSDAEFRIKPVLTLSTPNNNSQQWVVGSQNNVTWAPPVGSADSLKINFSTNGGKGLDGIAGGVNGADDFPDTNCSVDLAGCISAKGGLISSSVATASGLFAWTIPDIMTNEGVARIQKVETSTDPAKDLSDSYFYIKGSLTNVQVKNIAADPDPINPIDLPIDSTKYITWDYTGSLGTVDIYYSTDANAGTPTWTLIPDPDGAGPLISGSAVPVDDGTPGNKGSFAWKIPNVPSAYAKVKVVNTPNANWQNVSGISPNGASGAGTYNSIIGSITEVTVVSDGLGTNMEVGGTKTIQWKPFGSISLFKLEYRYNAGAWNEISPLDPDGAGPLKGGTAGTVSGAYRTWNWSGIPNTISNDVDFKISDYDNPTKVFAESLVNYTIKGQLSLVTPDA
ncbi:MAG: Ser-Thr-rich GPI-anchored membrane family protein, partial [Candidatus Omnitrophota bacterium]|nr:Ser-Thr-rich GPI-anchored membrane family protein [Candidatus Omnitrophota bacterium]